jgi:hypothetical protein
MTEDSKEIQEIRNDIREIKNILFQIQNQLKLQAPSEDIKIMTNPQSHPTGQPAIHKSPVQAVVSDSSMKKACIQCNLPLKIDQLFCTNCGSKQPSDEIEEMYYLRDSKINKDDMIEGLKFNYRNLIKISQSKSFTILALQLFLIAGILNAASTTINIILFDTRTDWQWVDAFQLFDIFFYSFIFLIIALAFFIEFSLKNMKIEGVSFIGSMRLTGFLSIILIIRGILSLIYNLYIYILDTGVDGLYYFTIFESISWFIVSVLLLIYLTIYISNRAGISPGFACLILIVMTTFTVWIYFMYFFNIFYILSSFIPIAVGMLGFSLLTPIVLQFMK